MTRSTIYFPGLNGIRAFAALSVLTSHVIQMAPQLGLVSEGPVLAGGVGVTVFFTLSGFLITFLLLQEKAHADGIALKRFYLRRILRIWPLYFFYLGLAIATFGIPANPAYLVLYVVFLPNIAFNLHRTPAATEHLWSIGVEEQFYALWPLIVLRIKRLAMFLVCLIFALVFVRGVLKIYSDHVHNKLAFSIVADLRFDCMATGALFAIGYERRDSRLMKLARTWIAPLAFWLCFLLALSRHFTAFSILGDNVVACTTGVFIISQIESSRPITLLENPVLSFLGKISYGLYVYHPLVIVMLGRVFRHWNSVPANIVIALVAVAFVTIVIASASYAILERPFLKLKDRFQSDPAAVA